MRAVIIDDDVLNIDLIDFFCTKYASSVEVVGIAENVEQGIAVMLKEKPDLVFLDIELGHETGFDILRAIDQPELMVVITSAFHEYAIETLNVRMMGYLLKPIYIPQFVLTIEKCQTEYDRNQLEEPAIGYRKKTPNMLLMTTIPLNDSFMFLSIETILRIESKKKQTTIFTTDAKTIHTTLSMSDLERLLPPYLFLRVHPSHIVQIKSVVSFECIPKCFLMLHDKTQIPVSSAMKNEVSERLAQS